MTSIEKPAATTNASKDEKSSSIEEQKKSKEAAQSVKGKEADKLSPSSEKPKVEQVSKSNDKTESKVISSSPLKGCAPSKCIQSFSEHKNGVYGVCMIDEVRFCSVAHDNTVKIWNIKKGTCERTLYGHTDKVYACAYLPAIGCIVSGGDDCSIRFWDVSTGEQKHIIKPAHKDTVFRLLSIDDGRQLVSAGVDEGDPTIKVWDTTNYEYLQTLRGHKDDVESLCMVKKNGWLASGSADEKIMLWDLSKGECVATLEGHSNTVYGLTQLLHQDNLFVSCSSDQTLKVWDVTSLKCVLTIPASACFRSMCSLPSNIAEKDADLAAEQKKHDYVAVGCEKGPILIYDLNAEALKQAETEKKEVQPVHTLSGHSNAVNALCYSPELNQLVSGSADNECKVWSADSSV
eukprot:TRINITY_DN118_c0_g2_i3.p1 TRINITY_DN118_c0_g2~~TRINITY_DN118_c0_g2_i3.p1  ORF type:complete len:404 (+),score=101.53 TRINITY_DN118_c0_g2_i3:88-1299(+)